MTQSMSLDAHPSVEVPLDEFGNSDGAVPKAGVFWRGPMHSKEDDEAEDEDEPDK